MTSILIAALLAVLSTAMAERESHYDVGNAMLMSLFEIIVADVAQITVATKKVEQSAFTLDVTYRMIILIQNEF